jgi:hypothetical protein
MRRLQSLALAAAIPLAACLQPAPVLHATAAEIGAKLDNYSEAVVPQGGTIVLQGDDAIYGSFPHGRRPPINGADEPRGAATLADSLHRFVPHVTIVDHGFPGDTVAKSADRWAGQPVGNLLILSFGYGDFRAATDYHMFDAALTKLVRQAQARGAAVFIVTTPPATSQKLFSLELYRLVARNVATKEGIDVFDSAEALIKANVAPSTDEHGAAAIYQAIAGAMVPYIQVVPPAPQSKQAGSAGMRTVRVSADRAS